LLVIITHHWFCGLFLIILYNKMVKIVFVVGKSVDNYPEKYTSRKAPKWLKNQVDNFEDFIDTEDHTVPSDVAMAMYIADKYPRSTVECINGWDVKSKKQLDPYDVAFVVYDAGEVFHCGGKEKTCLKDMRAFERAVKTTRCFVYPYPKFHKYIINKPDYYADLKRAGIPVANFFRITPKKALEDIPAFRKRVERKGWKGIIIKPSYAGYSIGIKVMKDFSKRKNSTLKNWFKKLQDFGFPNVTIQEFVPDFGDHFEIRTYWINEKYAYAIGTLTRAVGGSDGLPIDDEDTFESEGGNIPDRVKRKLKILAKEVQKSILQYPYKHPLMRIDFGCCINSRGCKDSYFVNEVETMSCNLLAEDTDYPAVEKVAIACYSFANKVKGKSEPKGRKSNYKSKQVCVLPPKDK
jgi:hypothetical protein